jgi:lysophospholipase L1-like esterase
VTTLAPIRWLALGDSFTIGTGVGAERAFPAVLARRWDERGIPCEVTNPSVNGYTTGDLIREELPLAGEIRPTLVTVLIGANDIVRGPDERAYRARLTSIYRDLLAVPVEPSAIHALPQPDWSLSPAGASYGDPAAIARRIERFNAIAREQVERAGGRYIDIFPLMREQARRAMLAPDGLHPSAEAHEQWAAALDELLRPAPPPGSPLR